MTKTTGGKNQQKENKFSIANIIKSPLQLLFYVFVLFTCFLFLPFTYYNYLYYNERVANAPPGYKWPVLSDFREAVLYSFIILALLELSNKVFYSMFVPCSKGNRDPDEVLLRCTKASACFSKMIFMALASAQGYYIFKDAYFFPSYLGGKGDYTLLFKG